MIELNYKFSIQMGCDFFKIKKYYLVSYHLSKNKDIFDSNIQLVLSFNNTHKIKRLFWREIKCVIMN